MLLEKNPSNVQSDQSNIARTKDFATEKLNSKFVYKKNWLGIEYQKRNLLCPEVINDHAVKIQRYRHKVNMALVRLPLYANFILESFVISELNDRKYPGVVKNFGNQDPDLDPELNNIESADQSFVKDQLRELGSSFNSYLDSYSIKGCDDLETRRNLKNMVALLGLCGVEHKPREEKINSYYNLACKVEGLTEEKIEKLAKQELLSPASLLETLSKIKKHKDAMKKHVDVIWEANVRLVLKEAQKFASKTKHKQDSFEEFSQEANLGLSEAILRYKPTHGTRFSTYAIFWIRKYIVADLHKNSGVLSMPSRAWSVLKKYNNLQEKSMSENEKRTTNHQAAKELKFDREHLELILSAHTDGAAKTHKRPDEDVDCPIQPNTPINAINQPEPEAILEEKETTTQIHRALSSLPEINQQVVTLFMGIHTGEDLCVAQISTRLGIQRRKVKDLINESMQKLKRSKDLVNLKDLLFKGL